MKLPNLPSALRILHAEFEEAARRLPHDETKGRPYAFFGSTVLALHGLRDQINDIDVFVSPEIWELCAGRVTWRVALPDPDHPAVLIGYAGGYVAHAFYRWRSDEDAIDADRCRRIAEEVSGVWCAPLTEIQLHKRAAIAYHGTEGRYAKHVADLQVLDSQLPGLQSSGIHQEEG